MALEPGSNTETEPTHDYNPFTGSDKDNFTASSKSCCTIFGLNNNSSSNYGLETQLKFALDDQSPISSLPTIVGVGDTGVQTINVPASDPGVPGLNHFAFRLPGSLECGGCASAAHAGLTINATSGQVSWDTTGQPLGLYYHSFVIEERRPASALVSTTMVAGLIRVSNQTTNNAPFYEPPTPADSTECTVAPGSNLAFSLKASDRGSTDTVTIIGSGIPAGASYTNSDGNPATGSFSWTPTTADEGDYVVNFQASRGSGWRWRWRWREVRRS